MEEFVYFKHLNSLNSNLLEVYEKNKSHAYLLISEDRMTANLSAKLFALFFVCENKQKKMPCFNCAACQKVINNTSVDIFTYPKKTSIIVEDIKDIIANAQSKPLDFNYKIFILNNMNEANLSSQNKLLKTLEEPPSDVIFILTAPSEKTVLPTIASRVKTVILKRVTRQEIASVITIIQEDSQKTSIALDVAQGNLGKALSVIKNEVYFNVYHFCLDLVCKMNHSKNVLQYSSIIEKNKKFVDIYLEVLTMFYRDVLILKEDVPSAVINQNVLASLDLVSKNYSKLALIKILEKIDEAKKMIEYNTSVTAVIDALLLGILEVKHKWKTS